MGTFSSGCQRQYFLLLAKMCDQTQEYCQPEKLTQAFGVQSLPCRSVTYYQHGSPLVSIQSLPEVQANPFSLQLLWRLELMWLVSNIINHIVRLSVTNPAGKRRYSCQAGYSKGL